MKHPGKLFGYAEVEVRSANMEKTLKTFAESGIYVTRAKRISYTRLECDIDIMSVRRAAKLADIRVIERKGAARCISAIKRHAALLCTAAAGAAIIAAASCMCRPLRKRRWRSNAATFSVAASRGSICCMTKTARPLYARSIPPHRQRN